jgi:hypothetical protein
VTTLASNRRGDAVQVALGQTEGVVVLSSLSPAALAPKDIASAGFFPDRRTRIA